jgi:hypothetical protein
VYQKERSDPENVKSKDLTPFIFHLWRGTDDFLGPSNGQGLCLNQVNLSTIRLDGPEAH